MTIEEYEAWQDSKDVYPDNDFKLAFYALGVSGESGEVAEKVKKYFRDGILSREALAYELGDVLWYLTRLGHYIGYSLQDIINMNVQKLEDRHTRGKVHGEGDSR